ncbi:lamin tail-like protein [Labedella gwakjiensis]|uniref:Lamin tail-like protein n=1 Tax=Labedella gwakjiensis TaxID=390269 RepID=A0A2P8GTN0_9MICO|nr:lamin tail domain-containing protein [Labedella gwakjiensis]PSL37305.1 lamin tail-like protein [Labedella gwakjiensis]
MRSRPRSPHRSRALSALAAAVPLLATIAIAPTLVVDSAAAAEPTDIRINEVVQNGGTAGDWIEFTNTGSEAVDVSGWIVKDDNDTRTDALPAGSVIAPGGYLVFGEPGLTFGLGRADQARLFLPDGTTEIDAFAWTDHSPTSYGRCADGTGEFTVTAASTPGAANACGADPADVVVINEIESSGGTPGDWIELTNTGLVAVDAAGLVIRDSDDTHTFVVPADSTIEPGGYLVVGEPEMTFGLGGADSVRLFDTDGTTLVDEYAWTQHAATTYGRFPNGTGEFTETLEPTKGAANTIPTPEGLDVRINEIESNGGTPGDWVELVNPTSAAIDVSGWIVKDSDDTHVSTLPTGASVPAGGYYVVEEAQLGYGLGASDAVRLFAPDGVTIVDQYAWTAHAATSYGRCPDATGEFALQTSTTKAAANDCGSPIRINEVESSGGDPVDWIELVNNGAEPVDVSGMILKDDNDARTLAIASGTTIAAGGYLAVDVDVDGGFGLGGADSARLFDTDGTTLIDGYSWTEHAATSYGRCPDGTGEFALTTAPTKGATNACDGDLVTEAWPGGETVSTVDEAGYFGTNMSGLAFEDTDEGSGTDTLWAVKNGPGTLYRLENTDGTWAPVTDAGWADGKTLHYADGTGDVDAEGVALTDAGADGGIFVSTERNNAVSGTSRPSVIRYDVGGTGTEISATREWNLAADLATDVPTIGANAGLEGIAWIPDADLVAKGFVDESTGALYDPADYPGHGGGLFVVGLEANGSLYVYALGQETGDITRIATVASGFLSIMDLEYDPATDELWAVCDDTCDGRSAVLDVVGTDSAADADTADAVAAAAPGAFAVETVVERPAGMPNVNNEGFAIAPNDQCSDGVKPVVWSDDNGTDGFSLREGTILCTLDEPTEPTPGPTDPGTDPSDPDTGAGPDAPGTGTDAGAGDGLAVTGAAEPIGALAAALVLLLAGAAVVVARRRSHGAAE